MLYLPKQITIRLETISNQRFARADVLFSVHAIARRKNDYWLGPYATDGNGVARITRDDLLADVEATHDSGLMDYAGIDDCDSVVELQIWTAEAICNAIHARSKTWRSLLKGEERRWKSLAELIALYQRALAAISESWQPAIWSMPSDWSEPDATPEHVFIVKAET